jgi:hypothetical protein
MPFNKMAEIKKNKDLGFFLLIPFIIYFYFLKWKLTSIHDDDLYVYTTWSGASDFFHKSNISLAFGQYRPIRDFALHIIIQLFDRHFTAYYLFNVVIQSVNTIIFACLLNLLLRSMRLSLFLSLIFGLSRFCMYNVTQLFDGGILEGLSMTFFLLFLSVIVKISAVPGITVSEQRKGILWCILFANLGLYTHERYIAVFPFILLMVLFFPGFKGISTKHKAIFSLLTIASILLNIIIKTRILSIGFLNGTGGTHIAFSFSTAIRSLGNALCAIFQYGNYPEYMAGLQFSSLPVVYQGLVIASTCILLAVLGLFLWKGVAKLISRQKDYPANIALFVFLPALFFLCLVPCIFQPKIELRWMQAPLCILILMFVIALNGLTPNNNNRKHLLSILLGVSFLFTNYYYVDKGSRNLYYISSARIGNAFDKAIKDSIIDLGRSNLYVWEKKRNKQSEDEINWSTVNGHFFEPYHTSRKKLIFTDSLSSFSRFNAGNDEILYIDVQRDGNSFNFSVANITAEYLKDSLRNFNEKTFGIRDPSRKVRYDQKRLGISISSIGDFLTDGFYPYESGISWTDGKASIGFMGDFLAVDTLSLVLNTYMPPICKDVHPVILVRDKKDKSYQAFFSKREGDKFTFLFHFDKPTPLQKIDIVSERINSYPDERVLSFPFISMEITNGSSR